MQYTESENKFISFMVTKSLEYVMNFSKNGITPNTCALFGMTEERVLELTTKVVRHLTGAEPIPEFATKRLFGLHENSIKHEAGMLLSRVKAKIRQYQCNPINLVASPENLLQEIADLLERLK